jgi:hypothetical protein
VAELPHHRDGVLADREEERGEGVAERVRGDSGRQRRLAAGLEQLLGAGQDRSEDPQADVVLGPRSAPARREDQLAHARAAAAIAVEEEMTSQGREHPDLPDPRRRLRVPDVDRRGREVEVSPAEGGELMYAQAERRPAPRGLHPARIARFVRHAEIFRAESGVALDPAD